MDEGTALKLLLRKNIEIYRNDENAYTIVRMLGCLLLALDLAGISMKMAECKPAEWLENFKNNSAEYLNPEKYVQDEIGNDYGKSIFTVWNNLLECIKINPLAVILIQSVVFLHPDNISLILFEHCTQNILKLEGLEGTISSNTLALKIAAGMLANFSLVRRTVPKDRKQDDDLVKDTLAIHRLVQTAILFKIE